MSLAAGSVTAASDGTPSGSGLALALYQQRKIPIDANLAAAIAAGATIPGSFWSGLASQCNADATAIVSHVTSNAVASVVVHTTDSALQRMSNPVTASADTQGPSANKTLTGTVS